MSGVRVKWRTAVLAVPVALLLILGAILAFRGTDQVPDDSIPGSQDAPSVGAGSESPSNPKDAVSGQGDRQEGPKGSASEERLVLRSCSEEAKAQGCEEFDAPDPSIEESKRFEAVSWGRALDWWPYEPLLQSTWFPKPDPRESLYAWSDGGGTKGDPSEHRGAVVAFYMYPPASPSTHSMQGVIDEGGWYVMVSSFKNPAEAPWQFNPWEPVVVRGRTAKLVRLTEEDSGLDFRGIVWERSTSGSSIIQWVIASNPHTYTDDEAVEFTNRLIERRS